MVFKSHKQVLCRCCGKPIRKHTSTVYIEREAKAYHKGSDLSRYVYTEEPVVTVSECVPLSNMKIVAVKRSLSRSEVKSFSEWDGASYADRFFCTTRCARDFGYFAAERSDVATAPYRDAVDRSNGREPK